MPLEWQGAAITLKLSLLEDTGASVAAMTTNIPESADSGRNWDDRYCWLRDTFFVVRALNSLSEVGTMEDYLSWLNNVVLGAGNGHIQPLYGIGLERELPERTLDHLPGYRDMGPVRVGNRAAEHFEHAVYGNIILGAAQAFHDHRLLHRAGAAEITRLELVGEPAVQVYGQPDAGMWELRTRARVHPSSALMSWAACDRLGKIALARGLPERAEYWRSHAERMQDEILDKSWNEQRQAFAESFGGNELDTSVQLMVEVGLVNARAFRASSAPWMPWEKACAMALTGAVMKPQTTSVNPRPPSISARSGASTRWPALAGCKRRASFLRPCRPYAIRWACSRKTRTPKPVECGVISRRPVPWWESSIPQCASLRSGTA